LVRTAREPSAASGTKRGGGFWNYSMAMAFAIDFGTQVSHVIIYEQPQAIGWPVTRQPEDWIISPARCIRERRIGMSPPRRRSPVPKLHPRISRRPSIFRPAKRSRHAVCLI